MNQTNHQANHQAHHSKHRAPNKFLAPIVIAGVTIGFLASAYKFIFAKTDSTRNETRSVSDKPVEDPQKPKQDAEPQP